MKQTFTRKVLCLLLALAMALSLTATALAEGSSFAADNNTVALTVKTQVGDSTAATVKTYTSKALFDLAAAKGTSATSINYKYSGKGSATVVTATDYVKITDLLQDAGIDVNALTSAATIAFETYESGGQSVSAYSKAAPTKAEFTGARYYFDGANQTEAPAAILLGSSKTTLVYSAITDLQFAIGAESAESTPAGKMFPSGVATVIVKDSHYFVPADSKKVSFDFAGSASAAISKDALAEYVSDDASKPVEFKLNNVTVNFNTKAVKAIAGKMTGSEDITLSVNPNASYSSASSGTTAYNMVSTAGAKVVTLEMTQGTTNLFASGKATVTVPFAMPSGCNRVTVYYLNGDNVEKVDTATTKNDTATFKVGHFSSYVLVPSHVSSSGTTTADTTAVTSAKTGDAGVVFYAALAASSVVGTGVVLSAHKRKEF